MIKKVNKIIKTTDVQSQESSDTVELSWFDMQKPNLSAITKKDKNFIIKAKFTHLHEGDILVCEDGYKIQILKSEDEIVILKFNYVMDFVKASYEIGNRHQPISLESFQITILNDISLHDIISNLEKNENIQVTKAKGYFKPNGKAHHKH
ncbi:urease accessory protein UreE [Arcobacter sp. 31_11_sub10_T18]|nr:urease accessory protein UreE [Arcobacter sp. 31_11_sub10_T18]